MVLRFMESTCDQCFFSRDIFTHNLVGNRTECFPSYFLVQRPSPNGLCCALCCRQRRSYADYRHGFLHSQQSSFSRTASTYPPAQDQCPPSNNQTTCDYDYDGRTLSMAVPPFREDRNILLSVWQVHARSIARPR